MWPFLLNHNKFLVMSCNHIYPLTTFDAHFVEYIALYFGFNHYVIF